jgi:hypothetical protein
MIKNIIGSVFVVVGAFIFQIGYNIMDKNLQERFAKSFVEKIQNAFQQSVHATGLDASCDYPGCPKLGIIWVCAEHATPRA